MKYAKI